MKLKVIMMPERVGGGTES